MNKNEIIKRLNDNIIQEELVTLNNVCFLKCWKDTVPSN